MDTSERRAYSADEESGPAAAKALLDTPPRVRDDHRDDSTPDVPTVLNVDDHHSVGDWLEEMRAKDFAVPLQLCHGLSQAMKTLRLSFPDAFRLLWHHKKVFLAGHALIYDFSAPTLWER